ncbi:AAA domain-containing protein [Saccharomonospora sp. NPDC046836]|uniref:AAA domain-containing protein n=1 Tax=Saccharomonospora sp. NPDC046836 TaxID=3156921 RepID=UPI0034014BCD
MADWRLEAACAVEAELVHARRAGEWNELGRLQQTGDGRYAVDLRGRRVDPIDDLRVAGPDGPRHGPAVPAGAEVRDGVLWLYDTGPLPPGCDRVWARQTSPRAQLVRLARELRRVTTAPLADKLAAGELDSADDDAYQACFTPGIRLVWGPPGTGKSRLIEQAAAELSRAGKRVLIVAADDAPLSADDDPERLAIQEDLAELAAAEQRMTELQAGLAGYDHDAFLAAGRRIENHAKSQSLEAEFAGEQRRHDDAAAGLASAQAGLRGARVEWEATAGKRAQLAEARTLAAELAQREEEFAQLGERLATRGRIYRGRRADHAALRAAETARADLAARTEDCLRHAHPLTDDGATELELALSAAYEQLDAAARAEADAYTRLELIRGKIAQLRSVGLASDQDYRFHAECLRRGLPDLQATLERLHRRGKDRAARRGRLEERLWWLGERAHQQRRDAVSEHARTASVVRTAASQLPVTPRPFDVVLVDDAGSARLTDVLLAIAQARETAVVFGDFRQPGPRVRPATLKTMPEVRRWTLATAFGHCGIGSPEDAEQHPGCVVLTRQYRFGAGVRTLANSTGYAVLAGGDAAGPEIVLLDTAGEPVEYSAVMGFVAGADRTAVLAPNRLQAGAWLEAVRDRLGVAVGTARTVPGRQFDTVLVDLTADDWTDRMRSFGSAVTRARRRLFLLADLEGVRSAPIGSPLGAVNALRLQDSLTVRRLDEVVIPQQRQPQSATDPHMTVTN